jgi:hypothetical protein
MAKISINKLSFEKLSETVFEVTVLAHSTTIHQVTVWSDYALKLTHNKITVEELLKKSFEFLLQRESNNSILRNFDLSVIAHYFPEYEREISL